jgi:hypothetical protein
MHIMQSMTKQCCLRASAALIRVLAALILVSLTLPSAHAVIIYGAPVDDTVYNTTSPAGFESAWNTVGLLSYPTSYPAANWTAAVAIGSNYILTANHVRGEIGDVFTLNGVAHTLQELTTFGNGTTSAVTDLAVWRVSGSFDTWSPLYTNTDEVGKQMTFVGTGAYKGAPISVGGSQIGWGYDYTVYHPNIRRWGTNTIDAKAGFRFFGGLDADILITDFDNNAGDSEFQLGSGDSGGVGFINDNGVWKVAGVGWAVSGYYSRVGNNSDLFLGGMYDTRGLYIQDVDSGGNQIFTYISPDLAINPNPIPTESYLSTISQSAGLITAAITPTPEPSTLFLAGLGGVVALKLKQRRRYRHTQ